MKDFRVGVSTVINYDILVRAESYGDAEKAALSQLKNEDANVWDAHIERRLIEATPERGVNDITSTITHVMQESD